MKKNRNPPTWKQRWASERCFINKGRLASVASSIWQIAKAKSTTYNEYKTLMAAYDKISTVLENWEKNSIRQESKSLYKRSL